MSYRPPLEAMRFTLKSVVGIDPLYALDAFPDFSEDLADAVLEEAGKLAADVIAPLNRVGDRETSRLENGVVRTPTGFRDAYRQFVDGGWGGLAFASEHGGQGLPRVLGLAVQELWTQANMAFSLCPLLTKGAVEALSAHGTPLQQASLLPKLVSGAWTGTMNLTEPQAGSDVGALRTRAEAVGDGTYRIQGTKIFITWGEHDMAENIVHLVLARLPGAPTGTRGISLFAVPKFLVTPDGRPGARNDLACVSLEHKLGIHASPTCVMNFGEGGGAVGTLIGEENRGMACMFTMMNDARLGVGLEGVAIAERAFQLACAYAQERRQGKPFGRQHESLDMVPIIAHPDIRRMLATMKAHIDAGRALCYATAQALDLAHVAPDEEERRAHRGRADLLTPIAKAWCTDMGVAMTSLGVQIHGGMGYVEETGAAQHFRDARIAPIYEGTNGIQAIDLVTRKITLEGGTVVAQFLAEMAAAARALEGTGAPGLAQFGKTLAGATATLEATTGWMQDQVRRAPDEALAGAAAYLELFGIVAGSHYLGRGLLADQHSGNGEAPTGRQRRALAGVFAAHALARASGLAEAATAGMNDLAALDGAALTL